MPQEDEDQGRARNAVVIKTVLMLALIGLTLCGGIESGRAELQFQSNMDSWCRPSRPATYSILHWKQRDTCANNCFVWQLVCSNGKKYELQSKLSPATTEAQMLFYVWAPWSFLAYLLPSIVLFGITALGSRFAAPLLITNFLVLLYMVYAAWCFYTAATGNPWGTWVALERALFLNPYVYFPIIGVAALVNLPALLRVFALLFVRHPAEPVVATALWAGHPIHVAAMQTALMPSLYEFIDPGETTSYYRRQTEQARALKEKLDADAALAEAVIRRERARHRLSDQN